MLIYGWIIHGSKKSADLSSLHPLHDDSTFIHKPVVLFHDQEPLQYNMYSQEELYCEAKKRYPTFSDSKLQYVATLNLRCLTTPIASVNDQILLVHSEQRSSSLRDYEQHGCIGVYFWSHALIAADWFRYAEHDPILCPDINSIKTDFLIYNRAWCGTREYRLAFTNNLCQQGLHVHSLISFSPYDTGVHYRDHVMSNTAFETEFEDLENLLPINVHDSNSSADYNNLDYKNCGIEVVLETLFDDTRWHLTEKSLRPIACGRPFILMATPGSLAYLRSYGFETFDSLIDETYDTIQDHASRLSAVLAEMQRIANLPLREKRQLWSKLYTIAERNKRLFFSTEWQHSIETEFFQNLNAGIAELASRSKGTIRKRMLELNSNS